MLYGNTGIEALKVKHTRGTEIGSLCLVLAGRTWARSHRDRDGPAARRFQHDDWDGKHSQSKQYSVSLVNFRCAAATQKSQRRSTDEIEQVPDFEPDGKGYPWSKGD